MRRGLRYTRLTAGNSKWRPVPAARTGALAEHASLRGSAHARCILWISAAQRGRCQESHPSTNRTKKPGHNRRPWTLVLRLAPWDRSQEHSQLRDHGDQPVSRRKFEESTASRAPRRALIVQTFRFVSLPEPMKSLASTPVAQGYHRPRGGSRSTWIAARSVRMSARVRQFPSLSTERRR